MARKKIKRVMKNTKLILALILLFAAVTRGWRVGNPDKYYFDEVYHAFTAKAYADNDPRGYEWWHQAPEGVAYEWLHPPVSKLLMGLSIRMFGHHGWVWRLPSVVFGVMVIGGVYWLTKELFGDEGLALVAAFLASLDGLLLAQSRIAMNDIFLVFFVLAALTFYWRWCKKSIPGYTCLDSPKANRAPRSRDFNLLLAGVFVGLAVATKWSGVFVVGIIGVWELGQLVAGLTKIDWRRWVKLGLAFGVLPMAVYYLSFTQFWLQGHAWRQFVELHKQIWWYETNLEATHPYQSKPWQWVLNLKPVWYYVDYTQEGQLGNIYALMNPVIAWGGLVGMVWLVSWGLLKKERGCFYVVLAYLLFWVPWVFSPRIMFFYHYAPAVPLLTVGLGHLVWSLGKADYGVTRVVAGVSLLGAMLMFGYFYPHWTGLLLPKEWVEQYYWFESWR